MNQAEIKKIKKVLLLGSGALKIGEAGEFDYSGSQTFKKKNPKGYFWLSGDKQLSTAVFNSINLEY